MSSHVRDLVQSDELVDLGEYSDQDEAKMLVIVVELESTPNMPQDTISSDFSMNISQ